MPKIYLLSLGCPRNLVDSEVLLGRLKEKGFKITERPEDSDVLIVNTCGFIKSAKEESIEIILKLAAIKTGSQKISSRLKKLIVAGCLAQRYPDELKKEIPEIDAVFGAADYIKIPGYLASGHESSGMEVSKTPKFLYDHTMKRDIITPRHFAYLKLQEGCMNFCSYCVIPKLRGPYRSRSMESVMEEAEYLRDKLNIKEINLIGQDTSLYGIDRYGSVKTADILKKLSKIMKDRWLRILYCHPAHVNGELIDVISAEKSICKYIDLPIQHINDKILKKMNRQTTKSGISSLITKIRKSMPGIAIRTSIIVGFPGETEAAFKELCSFIKSVKFEKLGAFIYSSEEGAKAYDFRPQLSEKEKNARFDEILKIQMSVSAEKNKMQLGRTLTVLIDEHQTPNTENRVYTGRTYMDAPEVDGVCYVHSKKRLKPGDFVDVRITDTMEYDLVGDLR